MKFKAFFLPAYFLATITQPIFAQSKQIHGDQNYTASGLHSGNMIRTTFWNDGMVGTRANSPEDIGGEWPVNSGRTYFPKISTFIGAEVQDNSGLFVHIISEANGTRAGGLDGSASSGDWGPNGEWWSMTPLPGFYNENPDPEMESHKARVAMNNWEWSWPEKWPDKMSDPNDR